MLGCMTYCRFAFNLLDDYLVCDIIDQFEKDDILTSYKWGESLIVVGHTNRQYQILSHPCKQGQKSRICVWLYRFLYIRISTFPLKCQSQKHVCTHMLLFPNPLWDHNQLFTLAVKKQWGRGGKKAARKACPFLKLDNWSRQATICPTLKGSSQYSINACRMTMV